MELRRTFDDLVRFETELWNGIDATLQRECATSLGNLNILLVVQATPECRVNEIARSLSITVGGASQAVDRLESRGLARRSPNPANRRSSFVVLTPAGIEIADSAGAVFDRELDRWLASSLDEPTLARFSTTLGILRSTAQTTTERNYHG